MGGGGIEMTSFGAASSARAKSAMRLCRSAGARAKAFTNTSSISGGSVTPSSSARFHGAIGGDSISARSSANVVAVQ